MTCSCLPAPPQAGRFHRLVQSACILLQSYHCGGEHGPSAIHKSSSLPRYTRRSSRSELHPVACADWFCDPARHGESRAKRPLCRTSFRLDKTPYGRKTLIGKPRPVQMRRSPLPLDPVGTAPAKEGLLAQSAGGDCSHV